MRRSTCHGTSSLATMTTRATGASRLRTATSRAAGTSPRYTTRAGWTRGATSRSRCSCSTRWCGRATGISSAATSICNDGACRTNVHVVYTAKSVDPTHPLTATGEYSFDGRTWLSEGGAAFYEQHIDLDDDGKFTQAMQYDVDLHGARPVTGRVCYRIRVQDDVTGVAAKPLTGCLDLCASLVPFHNPDGYCPERASE